MKIIKLLMLCIGFREGLDILRTAIYVSMMMGVIVFICIVCTLMQWLS